MITTEFLKTVGKRGRRKKGMDNKGNILFDFSIIFEYTYQTPYYASIGLRGLHAHQMFRNPKREGLIHVWMHLTRSALH